MPRSPLTTCATEQLTRVDDLDTRCMLAFDGSEKLAVAHIKAYVGALAMRAQRVLTQARWLQNAQACARDGGAEFATCRPRDHQQGLHLCQAGACGRRAHCQHPARTRARAQAVAQAATYMEPKYTLELFREADLQVDITEHMLVCVCVCVCAHHHRPLRCPCLTRTPRARGVGRCRSTRC